MSRLQEHIDWGTPGDGQGARLMLVIALAVITTLAVMVFRDDQGEPAHGRPACAGSEVVVEVVEDARHLMEGERHCIQSEDLRHESET